jgi:hypothetical protein
LDAKEYDIEKSIMKEIHEFRTKRYTKPAYIILDNETYKELHEQCERTHSRIDKELKPMPEITQYMGLTIVRTYLAGRGIAIGEVARP